MANTRKQFTVHNLDRVDPYHLHDLGNCRRGNYDPDGYGGLSSDDQLEAEAIAKGAAVALQEHIVVLDNHAQKVVRDFGPMGFSPPNCTMPSWYKPKP